MSCDYEAVRTRLTAVLDIDAVYLDPCYDKCYCMGCHKVGGDADYYQRGQPLKHYTLPVNWYRLGLQLPHRANAKGSLDNWHLCFHGTKREFVTNILRGEDVAPSEWAPKDCNIWDVKCSPCVRYAALDQFSPSTEIDIDGDKYDAKFAFQVLVQPNTYKVAASRVKAKYDFDKQIKNTEIEWIVDQRGTSVLYGLLIQLIKIPQRQVILDDIIVKPKRIRSNRKLYLERDPDPSSPKTDSDETPEIKSEKTPDASTSDAPSGSFDLTAHSQPWFRDISADEARTLIKKSSKNGVFLVRPNVGTDSPYVLDMWHNELISLSILQLPNGKYMLHHNPNQEFADLLKLVTYYKKQNPNISASVPGATLRELGSWCSIL